MPNYRRNRIPGATYFFTVNLQDRKAVLLTDHIDLLRTSVKRVRDLVPFHIDAWVVLPDHMHALWTLPDGDSDYPRRWKAIKSVFSQKIATREPLSPTQQSRGERAIWQRRYWEHTIRDDRDYATHMDYIHFNPVKHGLASTPSAWPFSSFQTATTRGLYPPNWTQTAPPSGQWGERPDPQQSTHPTRSTGP